MAKETDPITEDLKRKSDLLRQLHRMKSQAKQEVRDNRLAKQMLQSEAGEPFPPITKEIKGQTSNIEEKLENLRDVSEEQLRAIEDQRRAIEDQNVELKALPELLSAGPEYTSTPGFAAGTQSAEDSSSGSFQTPLAGTSRGKSKKTKRAHRVNVNADFDGPVIEASGDFYKDLALPRINTKQIEFINITDPEERNKLIDEF